MLWLVQFPLYPANEWLGTAVLQPLVELDAGYAAPVLSPVNSLGAAIIVATFALRAIYKRLFA